MTARILVVDDTLPNVKLLQAKLSAEYFDVLTAYDGPSGLDLAAKESPDLILLDVMMPGMDGFEVCERLRADGKTKHIPVVMVTALTEVSDRVRGLQAGADDFLSKPVNDIALFARVRSLVRLKMLMDELRTRQATVGDNLMEDSEQGEAPDDAKGKILLVDGSPRHAARMVGFLNEAGHEVQVIGDAAEALDLGLSRSDLDLIMVGIDIDGEDGLRLCSQFRSHEETRHVPLLLVLEDMDLPQLAKGLDLGVTDYLFKPVDQNELHARVRTQIRRRRFHDRLRRMLDRSVSMAYVDALTGMYNRRYMNAHLERKLMEISDNGKPVSVMMFDIDHFKQVNDTYGHASGDEVLKGVANVISGNVRNFDLLARYGGEEFVLIMPDTPADSALLVADRLRQRVASEPFAVPEQQAPLRISISAGVATAYHADEMADALLQRADGALYEAKRGGRNRVVVADPETASDPEPEAPPRAAAVGGGES